MVSYMKKLFWACILLCYAAGPALLGEEEKLLLGLGEFTFSGVGQEEARVIETLLQAYLANRGTLVPAGVPFEQAETEFYAAGEDVESPPVVPAALPDYTLFFSITQNAESRILEMRIDNARTGETARYTGSYRSAGELALKAHAMVEAAFAAGGNQDSPEKPAALPAEALSERGIVGAWRGDRGIEIIRFFPRGRGIAFFSSGVQMELFWHIADTTLTVTQISPNNARYYYPAPYQVARRLAEEAEPMRWELSLYGGGLSLKGARFATEAREGEDGRVELEPAAPRETEWIRTVR
jgi:hypothetical protein